MKVFSKFLLCICFIISSLSIVNAQTWLWARNITGTTANDDDRAVACDASNNIYVIGTYQGTITFDGTHSYTAGAGITNFYIVKYDQNKNYLWSINGVSSAASVGNADFARRIVFDNSGDFFVSGFANQILTFTVGASTVTITPPAIGTNCGFVMKVLSTGIPVSGLVYASGSAITSESMAIDLSNNITISGNYTAALTLSGSATVWPVAASKNHFLVQYTSSFGFNWAKVYTGTSTTTKLISIINCTTQGYYVGGFIRGSLTIGATTINARGGAADDDIILIKIDNSGNTLWIRHAGSTALDRCNDVCADQNGNAYMTGYISGVTGNTGNFDSTGTNLLDSHGIIAGAWDVFVAKYNSSGLLQWIRQFGDPAANNQIAYGILANDSTLAVTGYYAGNFTWNNTVTEVGAGNNDVFLGTMDFNGNAIHCLSANGSTVADDRGERVAWDSNHNIYITGYYNSNPLNAGIFSLIPVSVPNNFLLKAGTITITGTKINVTWNGGNNGAINIIVTGGSTPYAYLWTGGAVTQNVSGLTAGTYSVTVTDNNGVTATQSYTLTQPAVLNVTSINTNPSCVPGSDGSVYPVVTGGTSPYTFNWGGGITTQNRTGLLAGSYSVTVTDANSITATLTATLTNSVPPSVSLSGTNPSCIPGLDGTINTAVLGGTSPYSYHWSDGAVITQNRTNLGPNTYTVTVTDSKGCTQTASYTLLNLQPPANITAGGSTTFCSGGSVLLVANGGSGYTYQWQNPAGTNIPGAIGINYTATISGSYVVIVTGQGAGCSTTSAATVVTVNLVPTVFDLTGGGTFCVGSTRVVSLSGSQLNVNYQLRRNGVNTGAAVAGTGAAINFPAQGVSGNYTVVATYAATGCSSTMNGIATLSSVPLPAVPVITPSGPTTFCSGGSVVLNTTITSGFTYTWLRAGSNISGANGSSYTATSSGSYTVRVTNNNGCTNTSVATVVTVNPAPSLFSVTGGGTECAGGSGLIVGLSGSTIGVNYQLLLNGVNQGSVVAGTSLAFNFPVQTSAGVYTVVATIAATGCTATMNGAATIVMNPKPPVPLITSSGSDTICSGNSLILSTTTVAGYTYIWANNGTNITGANSSSYSVSSLGNYSVIVVNNYSCSDTSLVTAVTVNPTPSVYNMTGGGTYCPGSSGSDVGLSWSDAGISYQLMYNGFATGAPVLGFGIQLDFGFHTNPGTYTVIATNTTTSCSSQMSGSAVVAVATSLPSVTVVGSNPSCIPGNDGSVTVIITGGTAPFSYLWADGSTTGSLGGLLGGTYTVTITDANGCTSSNFLALLNPSPPSISLVPTNPTCNPGNDGSIDLTVTGGTLPYTYNWENLLNPGVPISTNEDITSLSAGTYNVTVTDYKGCSITGSSSLFNSIPPSVILTTDNPSCSPGNDGSINLIISGGEIPYSYIWSNGAFTQDLNPIPPGNYSVTVTDNKGCYAFGSASLAISLPPSLALLGSNPSCVPGNDGSVNLIVTGGTSPYTYHWSNGANTGDITSLTPAIYTVTVTDSKACQSTGTSIITIPVPPVVTFVDDDPSCVPGSDGSVDPVVSGGTAPYTYLWGGGQVTPQRTGLSSGSYLVTITDSKACSVTGTTTLINSTPPSLTLLGTNPSCNPGSDGSINLVVNQGAQPFIYNWENMANPGVPISTNEDITSLTAGTYNVTVTDSKGCVSFGSTSLTNSIPPSISLIGTNPGCVPGNDGTVDLIVTYGNSPFSYLWSGGQTTEDLSGLSGGTYAVTVSDSKGCTSIGSSTITNPVLPSVSLIGTNPSCSPGNDGAIDLIVTGGTLPYSYSWSNGAIIEDLTGLPSGIYSVIVTDYTGCTGTGIVTLTEPVAPVLSFITSNPSCNPGNDGTIDLNISGGDQPYSINWSNGDTTENISGLSAGTYSVKVTDNAGCTTSDSAMISNSTPPSLTLIGDNPSCTSGTDGSIDLIAGEGTLPYSFSWSNFSVNEDITGLSAGIYNVTVTDAKNCTSTGSDTIVNSVPPSISIFGINPGCSPGNDGSVNIDITGGSQPFTYNWSDGSVSQDLSGLGIGSYSVTVTDIKGCTASDLTTLINVSSPSLSLIGTGPTCIPGTDGSVDLIVTGGTLPYTYSWFDGSNTEDLTGLTSGTYDVTVTDSRGCTGTGSSTILDPVPPSLSFITSDPGCSPGSDGTIDLIVTYGTLPFTYSWSDGSTTEDLSGLSAGVYSVTVSDNKGCVVFGSATLNNPVLPAINLTGTDPSCFPGNDGTVSLFITGGALPYNYLWSGGQTTKDLTGQPAGNYSVTVTDIKGCSASSSITLANPVPPSLNLTGNNPSCSSGFTDGSINLMISGGQQPFSFSWSDGSTTQDISSLSAGTYSVTVTDNKGCTAVSSTTIVNSVPPSISLIPDNPGCVTGGDGSIDLIVSAGTLPYSYSWSSGATTQDLTGLTSGTYSITVTDNEGCTVSGSTTLSNSISPSIYLFGTDPGCVPGNDGAVDLVASGGTSPYTYSWSNGSITEDLSGLGHGIYGVTVTDIKGCTASDSVTLINSTPPSIALTGINPGCNPGSNGAINLTVSGGNSPFTFTWSNSMNSENLSGLNAGTYAVTVTDNKSCSTADSITLANAASPSVSLIPTYPSCNPGNDGAIDLIVSGGTVPYSYIWSNSATTEDLDYLPSSPVPYVVTVTDANGCTAVGFSILTNDIPTANISSEGPTMFCTGGSVNLVTNPGAGYTYQWQNPAGVNIFGATGIVYNATTTGNYVVVITNSALCSATSSPVSVISNQVPSQFNITGGGSSCYSGTGFNIGLDSSEAGVSYELYLSGNPTGIIETPNVSGSFNFPPQNVSGNYTIVASNNGCISTMTGTTSITYFPSPSASIISSGSTTICSGETVQLTAGSGSGYTYQWQNPAGSDITGAFGISYNATTTGNYSVIETNSYGCRDTSASLAVTVTPLPNIYNVTGGGSSCIAGSSFPAGLDNSDPGITYELYLAGTFTGITVTPVASGSFNFPDQNLAGNYTIIASDNGCTSVMNGSASINYLSFPVATITAIGPTSFCSGGNVQLTATSGSGYTYQWQNPVGTNISGATGISYNAGMSGNYTVIISNSDGCADTSASLPVSVIPLPNIYSVTGGGSSCIPGTGFVIGLSNGDAGVIYALFINGNPTGVAVTPGVAGAFNFPAQNLAGTFTVVATGGGCSATMKGNAMITYYSKPVAAITTIGSPTFCAGGSVQLTATSGSGFVYRWQNPVGTDVPGATGISYNASSSGNYVVIISDGNGCADTSIQTTVTVNSLPSVYNVNGGGSSCIIGTGFPISLSNSNPGIIYDLYLNGSPTGAEIVAVAAGQISFPAQNLAGVYTIVASGNGCTSAMNGNATIVYYFSPTSSITPAGSTSFCAGNSVQLSATSGSGYTYQWQNPAGNNITGATDITFSASSSGNYVVVVTNSNGCSTSSNPLTVTANPLPVQYSVTGGGSSCSNGTPFSIGLNNGDAGVIYELYFNGNHTGITVTPVVAGQFTFPAQNLAGNYTVVGSANGCSSVMSGSASITYLTSPVASITPLGSLTFCSGSSVQLTATTGSGYTYQWQTPSGTNITGATDIVYNATAGGNYMVIVTSSNGCAATSSPVSVTVNPAPAVYNVSGGGSSCISGTPFMIGLDSSNIGITYSLYLFGSPTGISQTASVSGPFNFGQGVFGAGVYTVVATSQFSCSSAMNGNATITYPAAPVASINAGGPTSFCSGSSVILTADTSVGYHYQWMKGGIVIAGANNSSYAASSSGSYVALITNSNGCQATSSSIDVIVDPLPVAPSSISSDTNNICTGFTGNIVMTVNGGSGDNLRWAYTCAGSVIGSGSPFVTSAPAMTTIYYARWETSCGISACASFTINVNYLPTVYNIMGGGNSCTYGTPFSIGLNNADIGVTYQLYRGGAPVSGSFVTASSIGAFNFIPDQTIPGSYEVVATNSNSCTSNMNGSADIDYYLVPSAAISVNTPTSICSGDSVILYANTGTGFLYQWYQGGVMISGANNTFYTTFLSGNYSVAVTDANGCSSTSSGISVTVNTLPLAPVSIVADTNNICANYNGNIILYASAGTGDSLKWSTSCFGTSVGVGSPLIISNPMATTTYYARWENSCGNSACSSITINVGSLPAVFNVNGGGNSCTYGAPFTIMTDSSEAGTTYYLYRGGFPVPGPGITSLGTDPVVFPSQNIADFYNIFATNSFGCTSEMNGTALINYFYSTPATIVALGNTTLCSGDSVDLKSNTGNGFTYQWAKGGINIAGAMDSIYTVTSPGNYTVILSNSDGCTAVSQAVDVTINPVPFVHVNASSPICIGQSSAIQLSFSGSGPYDINISQQQYGQSAINVTLTNISGPFYSYTVSPPDSTTYTITSVMDDISGCTNTAGLPFFKVKVNRLPGAIISISDTSGCLGNEILVAAKIIGQAPFDVTLDHSLGGGMPAHITSFNVSSPFSYYDIPSIGLNSYSFYSITDGNGCTNYNLPGIVSVLINPFPSVFNVRGGGSTCDPTMAFNISLDSSQAGVTYQLIKDGISVAGSVISPDTIGPFSFPPQNAGGEFSVEAILGNCTMMMAGTVQIIYQERTLISLDKKDPSCMGLKDGSIHINIFSGVEPLTYDWSDNSTSSERDYLLEGTYSVIVTGADGCTASDTAILIRPVKPVIKLNITSPSCLLCNDGAIELIVNGGADPFAYAWSNNANTPNLENLSAGHYVITLTDNNGCLVEDSTDILKNWQGIQIYNAFTPNGDGVNDVWDIKFLEHYPNCLVKVYDQWGIVVFSSRGYAKPWDGKKSGNKLPAATYYYIIDLGDGSKAFTGSVNIIY